MSACEIRWCRSGEPATVRVNENIGDGAWSTMICQWCATVIGVRENGDLPDAGTVEKAVNGETTEAR